jgi:multicomponent Na+:H+ antiporter subunit E
MSLLLVNVLLALVWTAVSGSFSFLNFAFGFVLAIFALSLIREQVGSVGYFSRARRVISLMVLFIYELVLSSVRVAILVLSPRMDLKPGIIAYPLKVDRDFEITCSPT